MLTTRVHASPTSSSPASLPTSHARSYIADRPPSGCLYLIKKGFAQYVDEALAGANSVLNRALGPSDSWGADDMVLKHRSIYYRFRVTAITYLHVQVPNEAHLLLSTRPLPHTLCLFYWTSLVAQLRHRLNASDASSRSN